MDLSIPFTILVIGGLGIGFYWLVFKKKKGEILEKIIVANRIIDRLNEEADVNKNHMHNLLRNSNGKIWGKIISDRRPTGNFPTDINEKGEWINYKDIPMALVSIRHHNFFKLFWFGKRHQLFPQEEILTEEDQDLILRAKTNFVRDHKVWRSESTYPVATRAAVSALIDREKMEIDTNENATMMGNMHRYIPHYSRDYAMVEAETKANKDRMEAKRSEAS